MEPRSSQRNASRGDVAEAAELLVGTECDLVCDARSRDVADDSRRSSTRRRSLPGRARITPGSATGASLSSRQLDDDSRNRPPERDHSRVAPGSLPARPRARPIAPGSSTDDSRNRPPERDHSRIALESLPVRVTGSSTSPQGASRLVSGCRLLTPACRREILEGAGSCEASTR
jgi:hypothetical protein